MGIPAFSSHPRGLITLFFTEMWERASYYGMRAILVLFLAAPLAAGGMGLDDKTAAAIYGIYTACVYLTALPGGWIADRLLGMQNAVWVGGIIIALGHFSMAFPWNESFYFGLVLIVLGTGLLKPTISAIVGELYPACDSARRDAGFSIYYMGVNIGAIIGIFVCSYVGENINWHYGFAASGIGMVLGLIQFRLSRHHLGSAGIYLPPAPENTALIRANRKAWMIVATITGAFLAFIAATILGILSIDPVTVAAQGSYAIAAVFFLYMTYLYSACHLTPEDKKRLLAAGILFLFNALFWAGFEQAGSSFSLFSERYTDRMVGGFEIPAGSLQAANSIFVILLAPFFAALWVHLAKRNLNPSTPLKFALALVQLGLGFGIMALAATYVAQGQQVLPIWLIATYLLHTTGELCLSPIALSATTKLAPKGYSSQMLGLFFMSSALGNLFAGLMAGHLGHDAVADMPHLFSQIMLFGFGSALLLFLVRKPIIRMMGGVH